MFGFGKKRRTSAENTEANRGLYERDVERLQILLSVAEADVARLTACVADRGEIIVEKSKTIEVLSGMKLMMADRDAEIVQMSVRMANLEKTNAVLQSENQLLTVKANELEVELAETETAYELVKSEVAAMRTDVLSSESRSDRIENSLRKTHLALMSVIDEMECPETDGELPKVEEYLTRIGDDLYQTTMGRRIGDGMSAAIQKAADLGEQIVFTHNSTSIDVHPTDCLSDVERRFQERAEINRKINAPFNDIPKQIPIYEDGDEWDKGRIAD
jgi:chromosome segregation ATPase